MTITNHSIGAGRRRGVTVLEVLFATGIAISGMLGIASLLLMAGRQASQANATTEANMYAHDWYNEFVTREMNSPAAIRFFNDQAGVFAPNGFLQMNSIPSLQGGVVSSVNRHCICIDPLFFTSAETLTTVGSGGFNADQPYRPSFFPYYQDYYDPTVNPFNFSASAGIGVHPRLLRVSLAGGNQVISASFANQLFRSIDDVVTREITQAELDALGVIEKEGDETLPVVRQYEANTQAQSSGQYSWFATVCPQEHLQNFGPNLPSTNYTLSIVVCRQRDLQFFPPGGPGENQLPQGERIFTVDNPSAYGTAPADFRGGAGGPVRLSAAEGIDPNLAIGDWVLLTRYVNPSFDQSVVARWFRISNVSGDPLFENGLWHREVMLDGPDWQFGAAGMTQASMASGVMAVFERVIQLSN